jgi:hypothetical protein
VLVLILSWCSIANNIGMSHKLRLVSSYYQSGAQFSDSLTTSLDAISKKVSYPSH